MGLDSSTTLPRVTTGVPALDDVLGGGLPKGSVVFVAGLPGTGKSVLSEQALWANGHSMERVLYVTTLSEPMIKMLRFSQTFDFFKPEYFNKHVIYADLGSVLAEQGTNALAEGLDRLIEEHRPALVVVDSYKALRDFGGDDKTHRMFVSTLNTKLTAWDTTTILVGEYTADDIRQQPEFAVADGIIYLHGTEEAYRQKRWLRIMKMRGTDFFGGDHLFEIASEGITLYPRMRPALLKHEGTRREGKLSSAIEGLDNLIGGGLPNSTATLIMGESGAGKTLTALSFALGNAQSTGSGKTLFVSLEEGADQLARNCKAFGWELDKLIEDGRLEMFQVSPSELDIDRHAVLIKDMAEQMQADTVIIDSITSMETASELFGKLQDYLWAINDHFKQNAISTVMTAEKQGNTTSRISPYVDNLIELRLVEVGSETKRAIRIVKMRGATHDTSTREFVIDVPTMLIGERLSV